MAFLSISGVGCHFLFQGIFLGIKLAFTALAGRFFTTEPPKKPYYFMKNLVKPFFKGQLNSIYQMSDKVHAP